MSNPSGRPSKLTPELQAKLVEYISAGNYDCVACGLVGINPSTYYRWLQLGKEAKSGKYREFYNAIKKAAAAREASWIKYIDSDPSWQSKAWLLERRYPERWSKKETRTIETDKPIIIDFRGLDAGSNN